MILNVSQHDDQRDAFSASKTNFPSAPADGALPSRTPPRSPSKSCLINASKKPEASSKKIVQRRSPRWGR